MRNYTRVLPDGLDLIIAWPPLVLKFLLNVSQDEQAVILISNINIASSIY